MLTTEFIKKQAKSDAISAVANFFKKNEGIKNVNLTKEMIVSTLDQQLRQNNVYKKAFEEQVDLAIQGINPASQQPFVTDPRKAYRAGKDLTARVSASILREARAAGLQDVTEVVKRIKERVELERPRIHPYIKEYWERGCEDKLTEIINKHL